MLKHMRSRLGKSLLVVIVGAIALVFVLWGVFPESNSGGGLTGGSEAAKVGGERISMQELRNAMTRDVETYRNMGMDVPPEMIARIRDGALNTLVSQKLMLSEARRLGIGASDREVMEEIQKMPYFQDKTKKTFDPELYKSVLAANQLTPGEFEQDVREGLTNQRMVKFLEARIRITDAELEREYKIANETRSLSFVRFSREEAMKKMNVTDDERKNFLNDKTKETAIASYYAQNDNRYNKKETVCARHILKRFPAGQTPETAPKEAPKDFAALNPTLGNFEALAKKHSEDPSNKAQGGDLGCFPRGMMDKDFEAAAFNLGTGKVSAPVRSTFGWHYITVYRKSPAVTVTLEQARNEIAEELIKRERIEEIRKINKELAEAAAKNWPPKGATVETTGSFNALEGFIPKIGRADEILKAAFDPAAAVQTKPQVFEAQGAYIVAVVKERKSADMAKFKSDKATQQATLKERKLRAFMPAWMEDVKTRTKVSINDKAVNQLL